MSRLGMVVDLNRCVGCHTCTAACKQTNATPPGVQWRSVIDIEQGSYPNVERLFMVVGCQHCAEPPCVPVCPSGATAQRADGLVTMDYETCIGCGYCAVACPYQARTIVAEKEYFYGEPTALENATYHDERLGVANKCTFCVERIDEADALGLTPGVDMDVTPACAAACIASAIHFGDFADPASNVSRLAAENAFFQMHEELGTDPQIKYLYEVPGSMPGHAAHPEDNDDESLSDPENPLVGKRQEYWDYKAAMNFGLGGLASGAMVMAWLTSFALPVTDAALSGLFALSGAIMTVGLAFVFLKIHRKARFLNVLLRPASSWMTRETYCVALIMPAILLDLLWPNDVFHTLVGIGALGFLVSQAQILYRARGIPAWRAPLVPWMLTATGLLEGLGMLAVLAFVWASAATGGLVDGLAFAGIALTIANAGLWFAYRTTARARGIPPLARREIEAVTPLLMVAGHACPLLFFSLAVWVGAGPGALVLLALGGVAAIAGGLLWKFRVILEASYFQGYALPQAPTRGSGNRAAPRRLISPGTAA